MEFSYLYTHLKYDNIVPNARLAEATGANGFWIDDAAMDLDPYILLTVAGQNTERIRLGICVTNPLTRHVTATARAIASLQHATGGRAVLGMGRGSSVLRPAGLARPPPRILGEAVTIIRRLLSGEEVSFDSNWATVAKAKLSELPAPPPPVYAAASGPRMLEIAGRVADGVIISVGSSPECIRFAKTHIMKGIEDAGRKPDQVRIVAHVFSSISQNREEAIERVRAEATHILVNRPDLAKLVGISANAADRERRKEEGRAVELRDLENSRDKITDGATDEAVDCFTIAGTPRDCVAKVRAMRDEGVSEVVWSFKGDWEHTTESIGHEIMPMV